MNTDHPAGIQTAAADTPGRTGLPHKQQQEQALSTLQRNAIAQFLNRRNFSPKDIAGYDYQVIASLPKIGKKGIVAIRAWLIAHGQDLKNIPPEQSESAQRRHREKLVHAIKLLEKNGYRVQAPDHKRK